MVDFMPSDDGGFDLRRSFYARMNDWRDSGLISNGINSNKPAHLWWLLRGGDGFFVPSDDCTEAEQKLLRDMLGVHGHTIYKMLLIQRKGASNE
jgi:hypothetical protein